MLLAGLWMRLVGVAALATVLFLGCGRSDTSDGFAPNQSAATVTFHVKDMGTRLNLL